MSADIFSEEQRSYVMSRVTSKNTKPELLVRSYLHRCGFRFRIHARGLPGNPDFAESTMVHRDLELADFTGANLNGSYLIGADLRGAKGLLLEQVVVSVVDDETLLPNYLNEKLF